MGRAILYLQNHDDAPYRDIILHACLHNTTYDMQVNGSNFRYMKDIIDLSNDHDFYRQQILDKAATLTETNSWDDLHLLYMVTTFAKEGDSRARQIIYDVFNNNLSAGDSHDLETMIVEIDGLDGLLYAMDKLGAVLQVDPGYWASFYLIKEVKESTGRTDIDDILLEQRTINLNIDTFVRAAEAWEKKLEALGSQRTDVRKLSYQQVKAGIENRERIDVRAWSRHADEASLIQAAQDLLSERDKNKRRRYMQMFFKTPFPLDPQLLIEMIKKQPTENAPAFTMLENVQHPKVRDFALKLIAEKRQVGRAIGLLQRNFEQGDWALIEEATQLELPPEDYHDIQSSVRDVFEHNPSPDAIPALLNVYEKGPCRNCREDIVKQLYSIGGLTMAIAEECHWDASPYIREWSCSGFVDDKT